jgi:hypothetical protein
MYTPIHRQAIQTKTSDSDLHNLTLTNLKSMKLVKRKYTKLIRERGFLFEIVDDDGDTLSEEEYITYNDPNIEYEDAVEVPKEEVPRKFDLEDLYLTAIGKEDQNLTIVISTNADRTLWYKENGELIKDKLGIKLFGENAFIIHNDLAI